VSGTEITTLAEQGGQARAALIAAADGPRERIIEGLRGQGLEIDLFDRADELYGEGEHHFSVIALWVADRLSAPGTLVGPLARRFAPVPIVVICTDIERWEMRGALLAGAAGVVVLESLDSALAPCVQAVLAGQTCVPKEHWREIEPPALSAREKQILGLVVMGCMNSEIAAQLYLSESTVKSHLSSAFGKLGVRSRNEATNLILDPDRGLGMGILTLGVTPLQAGAQEAG
jgi:DNA-binding CsgD family transcriptional regulator